MFSEQKQGGSLFLLPSVQIYSLVPQPCANYLRQSTHQRFTSVVTPVKLDHWPSSTTISGKPLHATCCNRPNNTHPSDIVLWRKMRDHDLPVLRSAQHFPSYDRTWLCHVIPLTWSKNQGLKPKDCRKLAKCIGETVFKIVFTTMMSSFTRLYNALSCFFFLAIPCSDSKVS